MTLGLSSSGKISVGQQENASICSENVGNVRNLDWLTLNFTYGFIKPGLTRYDHWP